MEKRQDSPDAALTQEKARQQIRARRKHGGWNCRRRKCRKRAERSVRDWRHLTGIITALSSTAIIRSARRLTVCRFWHRHFRTARRWRFRLDQKSGCSGTAAGRRECRTHIGWKFAGCRELSRVREGAFHVMEPDESCKRIGEEDAVVLVPGLVFDRKGNRYGYGGGYYDRYFARFPKLSLMAVAFEGQIEEQLAVLPTDVRMHRIYTEEREYRI